MRTGSIQLHRGTTASADEVARTGAEFDHYEGHAEVHFAALKRALYREEPDYAD